MVHYFSFLHGSLQLIRSGIETLKTIGIGEVKLNKFEISTCIIHMPLCSAFAFVIENDHCTKFNFIKYCQNTRFSQAKKASKKVRSAFKPGGPSGWLLPLVLV